MDGNERDGTQGGLRRRSLSMGQGRLQGKRNERKHFKLAQSATQGRLLFTLSPFTLSSKEKHERKKNIGTSCKNTPFLPLVSVMLDHEVRMEELQKDLNRISNVLRRLERIPVSPSQSMED